MTPAERRHGHLSLPELYELVDLYEVALESITGLSYEDRDIDLAQNIAREALRNKNGT